MRSRPEVELRMLQSVHPGDTVRVELSLRSRSATPVEHVELRLDGTELVLVEGRITTPRHFVSLVARVAEDVTLNEGEHRYRAKFPLPDDAPCTYIGARAEIRYALKLAVSIPWWLDVNESYEVQVAPRPAARPARKPAASTTAHGDAPFVELSIEDQVFAPGDDLTGAVALGNVHGRKVRGVELSLVGYERVRVGGDHATEAHRLTAFLRADSRDEGRELPFRFRIPKTIAPSFDVGWAALFWGFEVRVDLARTNDIVHTAPITVRRFDRPPQAGAMRRQIGSGRWRAVWEAVGARHGLRADPLELRLTGSLSGASAAVWIDAGDAGAALTGELRWPSWGIDLQIGLKRFMLALSGGGDDPEGFGNRYRVRGRDPAQVLAVVAASLRRALLAFDDVRLDDEHVTVRSRTPGHDQPWLGVFLERLATLAVEIAAAGARIPPPAPMAALRPAWEAFARKLRGRLVVGRMSVLDGQLDGATFHVETCFDRGTRERGVPTHVNRSPLPDRTEITLAVDPPLEAPLDLDSQEEMAAASPAVRELVRTLCDQTRALSVREEAIVATLPAPLEDPAAAQEIMEAVLLLARRLRGDRSAGPYR